MAIKDSDFAMFKFYREKFPEGDTLAILGDCSFHMAGGEKAFKKGLGFTTVDTFDINGNPTYKVDLNEPLDEKLFSKYDWIIDSGTLYCCFNVPMVLKNMLSLLKDSGCCVHTSNLVGFFGRGYYSLSPALFKEFYEANQFVIEGLGTKTKRGPGWVSLASKGTYLYEATSDYLNFSTKASPYIESIPNDVLLYCVARRTKRVDYAQPIPEHFTRTHGK